MDDEFVACDQCGVRSSVFVQLPAGGDLAFCMHHFAVNADALIGRGAFVVADLRSRIH